MSLLEMDGVLAAISGADFPDVEGGEVGGEGGGTLGDVAKNLMARDKVLYHGHAVAAVAATSPALANAALEAIKVEYEVLPPVLDVLAAMEDDAVLVNENNFTDGVENADKPSNVAAIGKLARVGKASGTKNSSRTTTRSSWSSVVEKANTL